MRSNMRGRNRNWNAGDIRWITYKNHKMASQVYSTGELTEQTWQLISIVIPKIQRTLECNKHRTARITNHLTKIILRVITNRIRGKTEPEIAVGESGFAEGTRNDISMTRTLRENMIMVQKKCMFVLQTTQKHSAESDTYNK